MTTGDFIACTLLGCGEYDLNTLFEKLTDEDYFVNAVEELKFEGLELNAGMIWEEAIYLALRDVFGDDWVNEFDLYFNYIDSHVSIDSSKIDQIENFEEKAEEFAEKTGFEIEY